MIASNDIAAMKIIRLVSMGMLALQVMAISGCSERKPVETKEDPIEYLLADALVRASDSPDSLPGEDIYIMDPSAVAEPPVTTDPSISVNWYGPLHSMMSLASEYFGYRLTGDTRAPATPVVIVLAGDDLTLDQLVERSDIAAGESAHVSIDHATMTIEVRYRT